MKNPTKIVVSALVGIAGAAQGQTCMWSQATPTPPLPSVRSGAAIAYDPVRQRVVLFGGQGESGVMPDTFEWNGSVWALKATTGPTPRTAAGMAYHPGLGKVLLYGGTPQSGPPSVRTWMWDGTSWTDVGTNSAPQVTVAAMAYDAANSRMLLIGNDGQTNARMYEFSTATSSWFATGISGPQGDFNYAMAYDAPRATMVLHGGKLGSASQWWEFTGAGAGAWTFRGEGPARRHGVGMTFDPVRGRTVMFGGRSSTNNSESSGEVWECDGVAWTKRTEDGPGIRWRPSVTFDGSRVLSFGGSYSGFFSSDVLTNDTWRFDGAQNLGLAIVQGPATQQGVLGQAITLSVVAPGATSYQWYRESTLLVDGGTYSGTTTDTLHISAAGTVDATTFFVRASLGCGSAVAGARLNLSNADCYANCDRSTVPPILNVNDFQCFLNLFAARDSRANCDASTAAPTLNANDFQCFLGNYAAGCGG